MNSLKAQTMPLPMPEIQFITAHDGIRLAVAVYLPNDRSKPFPTLFSASPYRFDNNRLPATSRFMFRETGPIGFYLSQGYAHVHLDVRGSGRSEGDFEFLGPNEQQDLYTVIEWIAAQSWSNGKVGGHGQSYYCMSQWFMGIMNPPSLACLAAFDGMNDPYRSSVYQGGIMNDFFPLEWWNQNRTINAFPLEGPPREQQVDLNWVIRSHPFYDDFWRVRTARERLGDIKVPVYSHGIWSKMHRAGNIDAFNRVGGPAKLKMHALSNALAAQQMFDGLEFHKSVLLPFYDRYLKGIETDYEQRPRVEYGVVGETRLSTSEVWPPVGIVEQRWYLSSEPSESVTSVNDGSLKAEPDGSSGTTVYDYPQPGWVSGVVGFGPDGPKGSMDPARRVLTFTTPVLPDGLRIVGAPALILYLSSTNTDTDLFITLKAQAPQPEDERAEGKNPHAEVITQGWLRASHRELEECGPSEYKRRLAHQKSEHLIPGVIYKLHIPLEEIAYFLKPGYRLRLEIANGDSPITAPAGMSHAYLPSSSVGTDTVYHGGIQESCVIVYSPAGRA